MDSVEDRKQQVQSAVLHLTVPQVQLWELGAVSQDGGDGPAVVTGQTQSLSLILQLHTGGAGQIQPVLESPEQIWCCLLQDVRGSAAVDEPQQQIPVDTDAEIQQMKLFIDNNNIHFIFMYQLPIISNTDLKENSYCHTV